MQALGLAAQEAAKAVDFVKMHGPLLVIIQFRMPLPKARKGTARRTQHCFPHTNRPDGDNLEKFLNDALQGIIWEDDAQIVWLLRSKTWTAWPKGEIVLFVRELSREKPDYDLILSDIQDNLELSLELPKPSHQLLISKNYGKIKNPD
jgi:Holliday junction resolvase RusA-like endonuclease